MNYAEKMEMECRVLGNIARWMERRGEVLTDRQHSDAFCGLRIMEVIWKGIPFRIMEVIWKGIPFTITEVDGMTCQIERKSIV